VTHFYNLQALPWLSWYQPSVLAGVGTGGRAPGGSAEMNLHHEEQPGSDYLSLVLLA
jgi:hypothetical protein